MLALKVPATLVFLHYTFDGEISLLGGQ
uniref:Uncharacterized protein n=1 Tax=Arundo donax TaxID=35708 RepID=A0A0A9BEZ0_ARUDO